MNVKRQQDSMQNLPGPWISKNMARIQVPLVLCAFLITLAQVSGDELVIDSAQLRSNLDSVLRQYFAETRFPGTDSQKQYKAAAREYIHSVYQDVQDSNDRFRLHVQTSDEHIDVYSDTLTNYVGLLRGGEYGTSSDQIVLLGAHYDTVDTTPGVNDNGSGISALLQAMKLLGGCKPKHTIMFVAFDLEEYYTAERFNIGSQRFVNQYLLPTFLSSNDSNSGFQGAYILDTIMNYDPRPDTQIVRPLEDAVVLVPEFQPLLDEIVANNKTGDFLALIGRKTIEDNLYNTFVAHFSLDASTDTNQHQHYIAIPHTQFSIIQQFGDFLRSDHKIFWSKTDEDLGNGQGDLPALFITDTAEFRRSCTDGGSGEAGPVCEMCYHNPCDRANKTIDDDNLHFLAATTAALARSLAELAQCEFESNGAGIISSAWMWSMQLTLAPVLLVNRIIN